MNDQEKNLPKKVLVVDDDQSVLNEVEKLLGSYKIAVVKAIDWETALYHFNQSKFDLTIIELELEGMPGTALLQKWLNHDVESKRETGHIISVSKNRTKSDEALVKEFQDVGLIAKPFSIGSLLSVLSNMMNRNKKAVVLSAVKDKIIDPLLSEGDYEKAISIAKEKLMPLGSKGLFMTAEVLEEAGKFEDALKIASKLSSSDQGNMAYMNLIGRIHMRQGNLDEAQRAFETADKVAPNNIQRLYDMAELYLAQNAPDKSVEKYKTLLELSPEKEDLKYDFYKRLLDAGFSECAQDFCRQTSTPKELIRHYNNMGVMYAKKGNFDQAIHDYSIAKNLIPGVKELYKILFNKALAHINLKKKEHLLEANDLLKECLELNPEFDKAKEKMELLAKYLGEKEKKIS